MKENKSIIEVKALSKVFDLPQERYSTLKQHFVNVFASKKVERFKALDNVSFDIKAGEFFGIIGSNGSGKSTLLKILAQIYKPTAGQVRIGGRLSPFIELGVGFNQELTARENVFLNGAILGLSHKQIEKSFVEIFEFAELERFKDQKLKNFSSGMQVRLAFSIAIRAEAEILLVDEVLSVGDSEFQQKCFEVFRRLKKEGKTVVFVSHALSVVEEFCDRVLVLDRGKNSMIASPTKAIAHYLNLEVASQGESEPIEFEKKEKKLLEIEKIVFLNQQGESKSIFGTGDKISIRTFYKAKEVIDSPIFGLAIHREDGVHITGPNTKTSKFETGKLKGKGYFDFVIESNPLLAGTYLITIGIFDKDSTFSYDFIEKGASFKVVANKENQFGLMTIGDKWSKG
jgi:lipopolysaccharide transport system ATP-binding protein